MHRISTDKEFLESGRIIIDADGIPVDVPDRTHMEAADQALGQRITDEKWYRGSIPNVDLNTIYGTEWRGMWGIDNAREVGAVNAPNLPWEGDFGTLTVDVSEDGFTTQTAKQHGNYGNQSVWTRAQTKLGQSIWTPWQKLATEQHVVTKLSEKVDNSAIPGIKWDKGVLPSNVDLNQAFGPVWRGGWGLDNSTGGDVNTILNLPEFAQGWLTIGVSPAGFTTQQFHAFKSGNVWARSQTVLAKNTWTPWVDLTRGSRLAAYKGVLPANTDVNDVFGAAWRGDWGVDNSTGTGILYTYVNLPEVRQGTLSVQVTEYGFTTQRYESFITGSVWTRAQTRLVAAEWTPWVDLAAAPTAPDPVVDLTALEHSLRKNRALHRVGRKKVGRTAVALVLDHGTNVFNETLLPMLRDRNIPATIALNSDMYNPTAQRYSHDSGTTWETVASWWENDGVEIANHGRTHKTVTDPAAQEREVIDSLTELESNLPGVPISAWVGPAGLPLLRDELDFMAGPAERAMIAKHAVVVSAITPQHWPLTGEPRIGMSRWWIDKPASITSTKANLLAVPDGHGAMVSGHPELWGEGTNSTVADIEGFLDWLVDQREAGKFTFVTLTELGFAIPS